MKTGRVNNMEGVGFTFQHPWVGMSPEYASPNCIRSPSFPEQHFVIGPSEEALVRPPIPPPHPPNTPTTPHFPPPNHPAHFAQPPSYHPPTPSTPTAFHPPPPPPPAAPQLVLHQNPATGDLVCPMVCIIWKTLLSCVMYRCSTALQSLFLHMPPLQWSLLHPTQDTPLQGRPLSSTRDHSPLSRPALISPEKARPTLSLKSAW